VTRPEIDLLGEPIPAPAVFRKDGGRRKIGYAAKPGTGPKGKRCIQCKMIQRVLSKGVTSHKCELAAPIWSDDPATDIKPNAPACSCFERRDFQRKVFL
jgi:hypothetical protein